MLLVEIFGIQFALSLIVWTMLALWWLAPALDHLSRSEALLLLTVPHAFRHIGLVFLVPGIVAPELASDFAEAAAYGDLAAGVLAILTMIALRRGWAVRVTLAWLLTIVGLVDLANALSQVSVIPLLEAAWFIPTFLVPLLIVTHVMTLARLLRPAEATGDRAAA